MNKDLPGSDSFENKDVPAGEFIDLHGERFYAIRNVDKIPPFFISVVSDSDHWLFASSNGGLSAGRVSPEFALFPYITVDKVHECAAHTGSKTLLRVNRQNLIHQWEPFNKEHNSLYHIERHLYKNLLGNKLCFEDVNQDLQLAFRYTWSSSDSFGFVRQCELENLGELDLDIEMIDGLLNILPAGTPRLLQTSSSNLIDAYKWSEYEAATGIGIFALYSGITDRAEPCESLKANTVFCLGLDRQKVLISSLQLGDFRLGKTLRSEHHKRGIRGAYLVNQALTLTANETRKWQFVANLEQSQAQVVELRKQLNHPQKVEQDIAQSIEKGSDELARIIAAGDGFQHTAEENVATHHYANVLFNIQRGGSFDDQYRLSSKDFRATVAHFNRNVFDSNKALLDGLPERLDFSELLARVSQHGDPHLERLCYEYLPITFGRRHGDPSRPWNQFEIKLKDESGNRLLSYQGNWRDIFQNWEALALSYPGFVENMITKFVNASTVDGYNPYRITKQGIDWEVEEEDDPWSYIGYWGDHQIIYLLKLLELSNNFNPARLAELLKRPIYCYANVPYRIQPFNALIQNPKDTVVFDNVLADEIEQRLARIGADGKLVLNTDGEVYQVNLLEKLLVPLLSKLGNLVIDGGIWLNTQRPEWNDANNALVGQGLSMVTLYYLRRYISFLQGLLGSETEAVDLSSDVCIWLEETAASLANVRGSLADKVISDELRFQTLAELGQAASRHRQSVYEKRDLAEKKSQTIDLVKSLLDDALAAVDHSIASNQREDGLYHAYNVLDFKPASLQVQSLYPMLEGQVAALSAGAIDPEQAVTVLTALFESDLYREDQKSFMLYPDRKLPSFLEKNLIPEDQIGENPLVQRMLVEGDETILLRDVDGCLRFNADLSNCGDLDARLDSLVAVYGDKVSALRVPLQALYEKIFNHQAFTGRSGGMFGFEGLGCIYWHMVSKLLLVVQENFFAALDQNANKAVCKQIGELYYRVREGIGFNKTPAEYGAFPTDPYSHTPKHAGARQPGMTGQVKEEILSRFGELGIRVSGGMVNFQPRLLRLCEFTSQPRIFRYLDVAGDWQDLEVPANSLAFTWCQVPIIYKVDDQVASTLEICFYAGTDKISDNLSIASKESTMLFQRTGEIQQITLVLNSHGLFVG